MWILSRRKSQSPPPLRGSEFRQKICAPLSHGIWVLKMFSRRTQSNGFKKIRFPSESKRPCRQSSTQFSIAPSRSQRNGSAHGTPFCFRADFHRDSRLRPAHIGATNTATCALFRAAWETKSFITKRRQPVFSKAK